MPCMYIVYAPTFTVCIILVCGLLFLTSCCTSSFKALRLLLIMWRLTFLHFFYMPSLCSSPVIMLEIMSGRMMSFNIRIRISPGKPKYCLSRWERDAYSLTTMPRPIPETLNQRNFHRQRNIDFPVKSFWAVNEDLEVGLDSSEQCQSTKRGQIS